MSVEQMNNPELVNENELRVIDGEISRIRERLAFLDRLRDVVSQEHVDEGLTLEKELKKLEQRKKELFK